MKYKATIIVMLGILVLVVGVTEYVRVTQMISIQEREEELHRREMRKLFEMATQREISTSTRIQLAQLELKRIASTIANINALGLSFSSLQIYTHTGIDEPFEAMRHRQEKEKAQLREIRLKVSKQRDDAMTEHAKALADLIYAKKELARLGVVVK